MFAELTSGLFAPKFAEFIAETQDSSPNYANMKPPEKPSGAKPLGRIYGQVLQFLLRHGGSQRRREPTGSSAAATRSLNELMRRDGDIFTPYFASENTGIGGRGVKFSGDGEQVVIQNLAILESSGVFTRVD